MNAHDAVTAGLAALAAEMPDCEAAQRGAELYGAPRFSVFGLFGDKETTLSRVLANLFDPKGSHGQEALFLNELLREAGRPPLVRSDHRHVVVRTEAPVRVAGRADDRRLDILIETRTEVIGIENKIWAKEGEDQVADYWAHVQKLAGKSRKPVFFFISRDETDGTEAIRLPYAAENGAPSVDRLLAACEPRVRAGRIKDFIADFRGWIARTFGRQTLMTTMQPYRDAVIGKLGDVNSAKAIGAILASKCDLRREIIDRIEAYLRGKLSAAFPDMQFGSPHGPSRLFEAVAQKQEGWHIWREAWPKNCVLCVAAEQWDFKGIGYGVVALNPDSDEGRKYAHRASEKIDLLNEAVAAVPGRNKPSDWWRWDHAARVPDWTIPALATELLGGATEPGIFFGADKMAEDLVALAMAMDTI